MNRTILAVSAALVLLLTACSQNDNDNSAEQATPAPAGQSPAYQAFNQMPAFTMEDAGGNSLQLHEFKGKKVFVNLWATWCPPCRREMPSIEKLAQTVDTSKVAFVMLSLDDEFAKAKDFVQKQKLNLPIYYPRENLPALFNVQAIPSTFIFDETGSLLKRIDGGEDYDTDAYRHLLK